MNQHVLHESSETVGCILIQKRSFIRCTAWDESNRCCLLMGNTDRSLQSHDCYIFQDEQRPILKCFVKFIMRICDRRLKFFEESGS